MSKVAEYARVFDVAPSDDWVQKRNEAVKEAKGWINTLSADEGLLLVSSVALALHGGAKLREVFASMGEQIIQKQAPSFIREHEESDLQIIFVLVVSLLELCSVEDSWQSPNQALLSAGLWSALSFQFPLGQTRLEALRSETLVSARECVLRNAHAARTRQAVPSIGAVTISQDSSEGARVNNAFRKAVQPMLSVLAENAALDREELDFLWWLMAGRSDLLDTLFSSLPATTRAVVAGIEASRKLHKLPSEAHRNIVMRHVCSDEKISLKDLLAQIAPWRKEIAQFIAFPTQASEVFPLFSALKTGETIAAFADKVFDVDEWVGRALLEGAICALHTQVRQ